MSDFSNGPNSKKRRLHESNSRASMNNSMQNFRNNNFRKQLQKRKGLLPIPTGSRPQIPTGSRLPPTQLKESSRDNKVTSFNRNNKLSKNSSVNSLHNNKFIPLNCPPRYQKRWNGPESYQIRVDKVPNDQIDNAKTVFEKYGQIEDMYVKSIRNDSTALNSSHIFIKYLDKISMKELFSENKDQKITRSCNTFTFQLTLQYRDYLKTNSSHEVETQNKSYQIEIFEVPGYMIDKLQKNLEIYGKISNFDYKKHNQDMMNATVYVAFKNEEAVTKLMNKFKEQKLPIDRFYFDFALSRTYREYITNRNKNVKETYDETSSSSDHDEEFSEFDTSNNISKKLIKSFHIKVLGLPLSKVEIIRSKLESFGVILKFNIENNISDEGEQSYHALVRFSENSTVEKVFDFNKNQKLKIDESSYKFQLTNEYRSFIKAGLTKNSKVKVKVESKNNSSNNSTGRDNQNGEVKKLNKVKNNDKPNSFPPSGNSGLVQHQTISSQKSFPKVPVMIKPSSSFQKQMSKPTVQNKNLSFVPLPSANPLNQQNNLQKSGVLDFANTQLNTNFPAEIFAGAQVRVHNLPTNNTEVKESLKSSLITYGTIKNLRFVKQTNNTYFTAFVEFENIFNAERMIQDKPVITKLYNGKVYKYWYRYTDQFKHYFCFNSDDSSANEDDFCAKNNYHLTIFNLESNNIKQRQFLFDLLKLYGKRPEITFTKYCKYDKVTLDMKVFYDAHLKFENETAALCFLQQKPYLKFQLQVKPIPEFDSYLKGKGINLPQPERTSNNNSFIQNPNLKCHVDKSFPAIQGNKNVQLASNQQNLESNNVMVKTKDGWKKTGNSFTSNTSFEGDSHIWISHLPPDRKGLWQAVKRFIYPFGSFSSLVLKKFRPKGGSRFWRAQIKFDDDYSCDKLLDSKLNFVYKDVEYTPIMSPSFKFFIENRPEYNQIKTIPVPTTIVKNELPKSSDIFLGNSHVWIRVLPNKSSTTDIINKVSEFAAQYGEVKLVFHKKVKTKSKKSFIRVHILFQKDTVAEMMLKLQPQFIYMGKTHNIAATNQYKFFLRGQIDKLMNEEGNKISAGIKK